MKQNGKVTDFTLEIPENREIRILQITDMQPVDAGQKRFSERIPDCEPLTEEMLYDTIYKYIEDGVKRFLPDLIIATGDLVYGEFDDSGRLLRSLVRFMENLNVPWAPVFGNHDNESKKGVAWQCLQFENATHCMFKRGNVTGNGNYTIGITRNGKLLRVLYMLDSNGCGQAYRYAYCNNYPPYNENEIVKTDAGFGEDQLKWVEKSAADVNEAAGREVPKFFCFHIPESMIEDAVFEKGYQSSVERNGELYDLDKNNLAKDGDFGKKGESICFFRQPQFRETLQKVGGVDGIFVGHDHKNTLSVLCHGVRVTYGLKTGTHDYHDNLGTTAITVSENGVNFSIKHLYYKRSQI